MSEMIERVAKALGGGDWDSCPNDRPRWREDARAAIEAMREPTEEMIEAANECEASWKSIWPAMLDAATEADHGN